MSVTANISAGAFSFLDEIKAGPSPSRLDVLPVSVVELGASGSGRIRGNSEHDSQSSRAAYSPFPFEAAELCASLYLRDSRLTVDPFAGWGERAQAMARHNLPYVGFDISPEAIKHAEDTYGVISTLGDSKSVTVPEHTGLITCPPYWNLERYNSAEGLDATKSWPDFLRDYEHILSRFAEKAASGSRYCITTGDWRDGGKYFDLTFQTDKIMERAGFSQHDKVVLSRLSISKIKIMLPQAKRLGYTVKVHETLSVYAKS